MHEYTGEYTQEDYLQANRLHYKNSRSMKILRIFCIVMLLVNVYLTLANPTNLVIWLSNILWLVLIGYPYTIMPIQVKWYFSKQKQLHGETTIIVNEDRIIIKASTAEVTYSWLYRYTVSDDMILLFNTPKTFEMLPRRFIGDDGEFEYVKQFLQNFPVGREQEQTQEDVVCDSCGQILPKNTDVCPNCGVEPI